MNEDAKPELSIITSVYNQVGHTQQLIETLPDSLPEDLRAEFILINDGSDEPTQALLRDLEAPWVVRQNADNKGFAWRNNEGAKTAQGEYLLFLNNDVVLARGWLEPMLELMKHPPKGKKIGALGNLQNYAGTPVLNHGGIYFHPGDLTTRHAFDGWTDWPKTPYFEWFAVTAACMLISRDLFLGIGAFDERFKNGYEDVDLCLRLFSKGYSNLVCNQSRIGHFVSASEGRFDREDANYQLLKEKWGSWFHLYARKDFSRIFRRSVPLKEKLKQWRTWALALAGDLQPGSQFQEEPTMAWQEMAHKGNTLDTLKAFVPGTPPQDAEE